MNYRSIRLWLILTIALSVTYDCLGQEENIYTPQETYLYAHELLNAGKYVEAELEFSKIHINDSLYNEALYNRVVTNRLGGNIKKCLALTEQVIDLGKDYIPDAYINRAHGLDSLNKKEEALKEIEGAIEKFPYNYDLKTTKAKLLYSIEKYEEAIEIYKECIQAEPLRSLHHLRLAQVMLEAGGLTHAILPITAALAMDPESESNINIIRQANSLVSSKIKKSNTTFKIEDHFQSFEDTDDLISNYIALSDKYKVPGAIQINYIKQLYLLLSETKGKEGSFLTEVYLNTLSNLATEESFGHFASLLCLVSDTEHHVEYFTKNQDKVVEVLTHLNGEFDKISENRPSPEGMDTETVDHFFDSNGRVNLIGTYNKESESVTGMTKYFYTQGTVEREGLKDDQGRNQGEWKLYHTNGQLARIATFKDDLLEGESSFKDEHGVKLSTISFKNNNYNGKAQFYKLIGTLYEEGNFVNDQRDGKFIGYYTDGNKSSEVNYKNGEYDGVFTNYYEDGSLQDQGNYKNAVLEGEYISHYRNGQIESKVFLKNGLQDGLSQKYFPDGQLEYGGQMKEGNLIGDWVYYNNQGVTTKKASYNSDGKLSGKIEIFEPHGQLQYSIDYIDDNIREITNYDTSGKVTSQYKSEKGNLNYECLWTSGALCIKGAYKDGVREGLWSYYDQLGNLTSTETYTNDTLSGAYTSYFLNGNISTSYSYSNGAVNGVVKSYYPDGKFGGYSYYENGIKKGRAMSYYHDGTIEKDEFYEDDLLHGVCTYNNANGLPYLVVTYNLGYIMCALIFDNKGEETGTWKAVNGKALEKYTFSKSGPLMGEINIEGGDYHGTSKRYNVDGTIRSDIYYNYGRKQGNWKHYFPNGNLRSDFNYRDDQVQGTFSTYYNNGQLETTGLYKDNMISDTLQYYSTSGKLTAKIPYSYDKINGESTFYSLTNEIMRLDYHENDVITGYAYIDQANQPIEVIPIENGTAHLKAYYQNGNLSTDYKINKGVENGDYKAYHPNGKIWVESTYDFGILIGDKTIYYDNGTTESIEKYNYGGKTGEHTFYYPNAKKKRVTKYLNNEKHGPEVHYDENGNKLKTYIYYGDVPYEIR